LNELRAQISDLKMQIGQLENRIAANDQYHSEDKLNSEERLRRAESENQTLLHRNRRLATKLIARSEQLQFLNDELFRRKSALDSEKVTNSMGTDEEGQPSPIAPARTSLEEEALRCEIEQLRVQLTQREGLYGTEKERRKSVAKLMARVWKMLNDGCNQLTSQVEETVSQNMSRLAAIESRLAPAG
jgi:chromosome segregation ATPase